MDDETPKEPELDHQLNHFALIADLKAALEETPEDQHLKNALASTKIVPHG